MNEKQFEDALRTWPLAELPAGLPTSVMEKIKPRQDNARIVQQSMLKFRLTWMDFALGLFLSLLPVLGFFTLSSLPREFVLYLKYQWLVLQFPAYEPVFFASSGGIAMLLLLTFVLSLRYIFPRQISLF
jgi:hypothetical protein